MARIARRHRRSARLGRTAGRWRWWFLLVVWAAIGTASRRRGYGYGLPRIRGCWSFRIQPGGVVPRQQHHSKRRTHSSAHPNPNPQRQPQQFQRFQRIVPPLPMSTTTRRYYTSRDDQDEKAASTKDVQVDAERMSFLATHTLRPSYPRADIPGPEGIPSRTQQVQNLKRHSSSGGHDDGGEEGEGGPRYDVLVIGGGATGCGVALDAASRGLRVACVERGDFASETSSRSTKLVWAGLKYLASAFASAFDWNNLLKRPAPTVENFVQEFRMVLHCHEERRYMTSKQSHLVYWLPIAVPFDKWIVHDPPPFEQPLFAFFPLFAPLVFWFYDALSGFACPASYVLYGQALAEAFPQLDLPRIKYCAVFHEGHHNDARTNLAIAMTAARCGARMANYVEMTHLLHDTTNQEDQVVVGAQVLDRITGESFAIRAKKVVLAGGPFTDLLRQKEQQEEDDEEDENEKDENDNPYVNGFRDSKENMTTATTTDGTELKMAEPTTATAKRMAKAVEAAYGTHIVVDGRFLPPDLGMLDFQTTDGRFLFMAPWQKHVLIGTTDQKGVPARSLHLPPEEDIAFLLREAQTYLRTDEYKLQRSDVLSAWTGWRPLAADPNHQPSASSPGSAVQVSRDHVVSENPTTGVIFVAGGKWTTWREMAQDTTDKVIASGFSDNPNIQPCRTKEIVLYGGSDDGYTPDLPQQLMSKYPMMDQDIAEHLVGTYGGRALELCQLYDDDRITKRLVEGYPYVEAEVRFACREYACTVEDVVSRRTRLAYLNKAKALEAIPIVAEIMAHELQWSEPVKQNQINVARIYVESFAGKEPAKLLDASALQQKPIPTM